MNNYIKLIFEDLKKLWNNLDIGQKFGVATLTVITCIVATFILVKSIEPNWAVLYSDLSEADTAAIQESLKKSGYPVKVSKDKKAILVPSDKQDELKLFVAENDLIQDKSPGFELLDSLQLGSTDFKNQLTRQRIFQGELTRTIEKINGIVKARVQIAEPERSVFSDKDEAPSASVVLILEPGFRMKTEQVKAIKNLVAYSIPRLTPEKVFITDQNGVSLTDEVGKSSSDIESYKLNVENQTAKKVQTVLEKIVGKGNVSVQVAADIDFNSAKSTIESYIPINSKGEGVLSSQQSESELYDNPMAAPAVPSPTAVSSETSTTTTDNKTEEVKKETTITRPKNLNYQKQKNLTNYNVSKEIKQIIYAPGSIKRLTIAVAVNKILTSQEKEELKNLVVTASGVDENRGDAVSITSLQFSGLADEKAEKEKLDKEIETSSITSIILNEVLPRLVVLILGLVAIFVFKNILKNITFTTASKGFTEKLPTMDEVSNSSALQAELNDLSDIEFLPQLEAKLDPELERIKNDLNESILTDAAEATKLLISYIKD